MLARSLVHPRTYAHSYATTHCLGVTCNGAKAPVFAFINFVFLIILIVCFRSQLYPVLLSAVDATKVGRYAVVAKAWCWSVELLAHLFKALMKSLMMNVRISGEIGLSFWATLQAYNHRHNHCQRSPPPHACCMTQSLLLIQINLEIKPSPTHPTYTKPHRLLPLLPRRDRGL